MAEVSTFCQNTNINEKQIFLTVIHLDICACFQARFHKQQTLSTHSSQDSRHVWCLSLSQLQKLIEEEGSDLRPKSYKRFIKLTTVTWIIITLNVHTLRLPQIQHNET